MFKSFSSLLLFLFLWAGIQASPTLQLLSSTGYQAKGFTATDGVRSIKYLGQYVYVSAGANIVYFKRDITTGQLTYLGYVVNDAGGCVLAIAQGKLYAAPFGSTAVAMRWYKIDSTGKPVKISQVTCLPTAQMETGPDEKDIYLKPQVMISGIAKCLTRYQLDSTGKPIQKEQVTGKGLGASSFGVNDPQLLFMTSDGKFFYTLSTGEKCVAIIERQPTGEIAYKGKIELQLYLNASLRTVFHEWGSVTVSPDGKYLYANLMAYSSADKNCLCIFKRDTVTGLTTFQDSIYGDEDPLANSKGSNYLFVPNGTGGYFTDCGRLGTFDRDTATGRLSNPNISDVGAQCTGATLDFKNGLLYIAGNGINVYRIDTGTVRDAAVEGAALLSGVKGAQLTLSQNPVIANGKIMARLSGDNRTGTLMVHDLAGRRVQSASMNNGCAWLDARGLANGLYFVNVKTANGKTFSTKMTIVK
jgi:hypothetical protein